MRKFNLVLPLAVAIGMFVSGTHASEAKTLKAHEHGVGKLNIAFEASRVVMEFEAPGADIVGFEHPAETAEDKASIRSALDILKKPFALFVFPREAKCTVIMASAELYGEEDDHDHGHEKEHGHDYKEKHAAAHHGEGEKGKDEEEHHHEHKEHGKHDEDHGDHDDEPSHTEFHVEYQLNCDEIDQVDAIEFVYFSTFPNAREVEIQLISNKGAQGFEVERDDPVLNLDGRI